MARSIVRWHDDPASGMAWVAFKGLPFFSAALCRRRLICSLPLALSLRYRVWRALSCSFRL